MGQFLKNKICDFFELDRYCYLNLVSVRRYFFYFESVNRKQYVVLFVLVFSPVWSFVFLIRTSLQLTGKTHLIVKLSVIINNNQLLNGFMNLRRKVSGCWSFNGLMTSWSKRRLYALLTIVFWSLIDTCFALKIRNYTNQVVTLEKYRNIWI